MNLGKRVNYFFVSLFFLLWGMSSSAAIVPQTTASDAANQAQIITIQHLPVINDAADWPDKAIHLITQPNLAYLLLILGILGLFVEFATPGLLFPGISGAICLVVALYALQLLPVNYAGLGLLVLGVGCMIAEAFLPTFGSLAIGGFIAFVVGSTLLFDKTSHYHVAGALILTVSVLMVAFFLIIINLTLKARLRPPVTGVESLRDRVAAVIKNEQGELRIRLQGELWQIHCASPLSNHQKVKVIGIKGLYLQVEPLYKNMDARLPDNN